MAVSVKVFLQRNDGQAPEIRRFAVDEEALTNFEYLKGKITQAFPALTNTNFSLQWKDADGDLIAFSSDEEIVEALGAVQDGIFRVYVKLKVEAENEDYQVHPGVTCDGCEGEVRGSRYKCVVCPDYDLCMTCEGKGIHSEHQMMRIRTPRNHGFSQSQGLHSMWMGFGPFGAHEYPPPNHGHPPPPPFGHPPPPPFGHPPPPPHGPPPPTPHGHPPPPYGHPPPPSPPHGHPPPSHHGPPPPPPPPPPHGHPPPPPHGHPPPPHFEFHGGHWDPRGLPPQWRSWMRRCMHRWWTPPGAGGSQEQGMDTDDPRSMPEETRTQQGGAQSAPSMDPGEDYLKTVGEQVAAMLDPLGIDVAVDVEHNGQRYACASSKKTKEEKARGKGKKPKSSNEGQVSTDVDMAEAETGEKTGEKKELNKEEKPKEAVRKSGDLLDGDWTFLTPQKEAPKTDISSMSQSGSSTPGTSEAQTNQASQTTPAAAASSPIYPVLPPAHPNPKINEALQQMLQMGFTNEGNWLTQLLEAKHGNISQVLDAIKPH